MIRFLIIPLLLLLISGATAIVPAAVNQYLAPQNAARIALRLPPLTWDYNLASYAQWWADQRKYDCALLHSNGPYGENMFWGSGTGWTPGQVVAGHQARSWLGGCPRGGGITTGGITAALLIAGIILRSSGGIQEGLVVLRSLVSKGAVLSLFAIMILLGISSAKDPIDLEFFFKTP